MPICQAPPPALLFGRTLVTAFNGSFPSEKKTCMVLVTAQFCQVSNFNGVVNTTLLFRSNIFQFSFGGSVPFWPNGSPTCSANWAPPESFVS
ncbi:glycoside hydrolase family 131 protein [Colletotrichum asianum]